jgi:glycosyltransferase involved in cell wall biosynthesis
LAQTFQDLDIWIFDNCSNYDIEGLIKSFADPRIKLLTSSINLGGRVNFERIFKTNFTSEYVLVFHDDDVMHPQMLEREMAVMQSYPGLVWVGTGLNFCRTGQEMQIFKPLQEKIEPIICEKADVARLLIKNFHLAFDSVLYRKVCLKHIDAYGDRFGKWGDRPYIMDLSKQGRIAILKEPFVNYRIHPSQDSKAPLLVEKDFDCLKELFIYYRSSLPEPFSFNDRKLFFRFSTVNLIRSMPSFAKGFKRIRDYLRSCRQENL